MGKALPRFHIYRGFDKKYLGYESCYFKSPWCFVKKILTLLGNSVVKWAVEKLIETGKYSSRKMVGLSSNEKAGPLCITKKLKPNTWLASEFLESSGHLWILFLESIVVAAYTLAAKYITAASLHGYWMNNVTHSGHLNSNFSRMYGYLPSQKSYEGSYY